MLLLVRPQLVGVVPPVITPPPPALPPRCVLTVTPWFQASVFTDLLPDTDLFPSSSTYPSTANVNGFQITLIPIP